MGILYRHKKSIIGKPAGILFFEGKVLLLFSKRIPGKCRFVGFPEQRVAVFILLFIIHISCRILKVRCPAFLFGKKSFLYQCFQINVIRISRKGGKGLVGGIPVAGRS